jgi:hypothetical protein
LQANGETAAADAQTTRARLLLERQFVSLSQEIARARFGAAQRKRSPDDDLLGGRRVCGGDEQELRNHQRRSERSHLVEYLTAIWIGPL